jgi:hypothetical protein
MMRYPGLEYINFAELTAEQRAELKRTFREHKRALQTAMKDLDRALKQLEKKPGRKKSSKR